MDILQSALNLAIESGKNIINDKKDTELLDILLKHIKIEFTVKASMYLNFYYSIWEDYG